MRSSLFPGIESVFAERPQHVERWRIACAAVHWELAWRHEPTIIAVSYRGRQSPVVRILQISPRRRAHGRAVQADELPRPYVEIARGDLGQPQTTREGS